MLTVKNTKKMGKKNASKNDPPRCCINKPLLGVGHARTQSFSEGVFVVPWSWRSVEQVSRSVVCDC